MFLHLSVILFTGGVCRGRSPPRVVEEGAVHIQLECILDYNVNLRSFNYLHVSLISACGRKWHDTIYRRTYGSDGCCKYQQKTTLAAMTTRCSRLMQNAMCELLVGIYFLTLKRRISRYIKGRITKCA